MYFFEERINLPRPTGSKFLLQLTSHSGVEWSLLSEWAASEGTWLGTERLPTPRNRAGVIFIVVHIFQSRLCQKIRQEAESLREPGKGRLYKAAISEVAEMVAEASKEESTQGRTREGWVLSGEAGATQGGT